MKDKVIRNPVELYDIHECQDLMDFAKYVYENTNCNACLRYCALSGLVYPSNLLGVEEGDEWAIKNIYGIQFVVDVGENDLYTSQILEFPFYLQELNDVIEICEEFPRQ